MFERSVVFDGKLYRYHEAVTIKHSMPMQTFVTVKSTSVSGMSYDEHVEDYSVPFDTSMTFERAEELVMELPEFEEASDPAMEAIGQLAPTFTDDQAAVVPWAYPEWASGTGYSAGDKVRYDGGLYRVLQAHTSQEGWDPISAPSLFAEILPGQGGEGDEIQEWTQPDSTNPYMKGDEVLHNGKTWVSDVDNNVWEPGVYGWTEAALN